MKSSYKALLIVILSIFLVNCSAKKSNKFQPVEVYHSSDLTITQISENSFKHTSFKQTNDFGNVSCNGLIVRNGNEAIVFDTPTNNENSAELIAWITNQLNCNINAIIPTHFHDDCLGGLASFHEKNILSYAYFRTIELARDNNSEIPKNSFKDSFRLKVGNENVVVNFFGEGHTKDNVIAYFPSENVMFGGCLIKELNASKGYLGDANVKVWPTTVSKIQKQFPNVKTIVPGHGNFGDKKMLDYTIKLFEK